MQIDSRAWALEEFGDADLGDSRRKWRLVAMASGLLRQPSSVVATAFPDEAERQGAYDFLESRLAPSAGIEVAAGRSCAARAAKQQIVFVPVDGTGISLSDPSRQKEIGEIGPEGQGRGLKVLTALAVGEDGVTIGVAGQELWRREPSSGKSRIEKKRADRRRPAEQREVQHWATLIKRVGARFKEALAKPWFVIDREGDGRVILDSLLATGELFTVRSSHDRIVGEAVAERGHAPRPRTRRRKRHLRAAMRNRPRLGYYEIDVPAGPHRKARRAHLVVRTHRLTLHARAEDGSFDLIPINVVWLREEGTTPLNEAPLDWMLLTNHPIASPEDAEKIVRSYIRRWRIEEFHKTWKSAGCGVEQTQLRRGEALKKWATILASVAAQLERLKHLSRTEPDLPATVELTKYELQALLILKRRQKKRTEEIEDNPTIAMATRWIADLGGYGGRSGKSVAGRPGAITIGRGLLDVRVAAAILEELELRKKRPKR